jgi:hypothetical protein
VVAERPVAVAVGIVAVGVVAVGVVAGAVEIVVVGAVAEVAGPSRSRFVLCFVFFFSCILIMH